MDPASKKDARAIPPFDATLLGVAPATVSAFDATLGRPEAFASSATLAQTDLAPSSPSPFLPVVSVDFGVAAPSAGASIPPLPSGVRGVDLEVIGKLGEGGMGVVHLAHQRSLDRDVAIKTTRPDAPASTVDALSAEAVVTGCLEHPNIVPVHAFGRAADGRPVLVMKRVEGVAWKDLVHTPTHPLWETIGSSDRLVDHLNVLGQVANALAFAHSHSIVHRDVKPENVMVGAFGEVYLVDFGLAIRVDAPRLEPPAIVGSPAYMAPEMVAGFAYDARTDVYLLGATLYEILTGRPPHDGTTLLEVLGAAYESKSPTFDDAVPEELAAVCRKALAREPADRYPSARAFRTAITDFLNHRASLLLSRTGDERLAEAVEAIEPDEASRRRRRALLAECRFAYRQALASWSDNVAAKRGEQRCITAEARLEIEDGHAVLARALVDALESKDPEIVAGLAALEARLVRERGEAEALRRLAHDLDESVGFSARRRALVGIAGIAAIVSVVVVRRSDAGTLGPSQLVPIAGFMVAVTLILVIAFRRRLLANAFGRRITTVALLSSALMFFHRLLAVHVGEPVHVILAFDSFLFGAMLLVTAATMARFLALGSLFTFGGAVLCLVYPTRAPAAFAASTIAMLLAGALLWRPEKRDTEVDS